MKSLAAECRKPYPSMMNELLVAGDEKSGENSLVQPSSCVQAGISAMVHDIRQNVSVRVSYDIPSGVLSQYA